MQKIEDLKSKYIIMCGPIGVGKSTFTKNLSAKMDFIPFYEEPDSNPYLEDYYKGNQVSFELQQFFLAQFLGQAVSIKKCLAQGQCVVQDRSAYEVLEVFSRIQYEDNQLTGNQWEILRMMCEYAFELMPKPDLIIHLDASTHVLKQRIKNRGRSYESGVSAVFLDRIKSMYAKWMDKLIMNGAYLEGSGVTPKTGLWAGTRVIQLKEWGIK
jgi:deoxyadenosine/deoxycytidine kinase